MWPRFAASWELDLTWGIVRTLGTGLCIWGDTTALSVFAEVAQSAAGWSLAPALTLPVLFTRVVRVWNAYISPDTGLYILPHLALVV